MESGPLDENNRECRDVFCCLLFFLNICGMIYCTIHAYTNGNPNRIYRGVSGTDICGQPGGDAENYPYVYFYNPLEDLTDPTSKRKCVSACPTYSGDSASLPTISCYGTATPDCADTATYIYIPEDGNYTAPGSFSNNILIYESSGLLGRVCAPSSKVLLNAFASIANSFTTSLQQGSFASLTTDVQNVTDLLILELDVATSRSRLRYRRLPPLHVPP